MKTHRKREEQKNPILNSFWAYFKNSPKSNQGEFRDVLIRAAESESKILGGVGVEFPRPLGVGVGF